MKLGCLLVVSRTISEEMPLPAGYYLARNVTRNVTCMFADMGQPDVPLLHRAPVSVEVCLATVPENDRVIQVYALAWFRHESIAN